MPSTAPYAVLAPGARLAVMSYHSLEDKLVRGRVPVRPKPAAACARRGCPAHVGRHADRPASQAGTWKAGDDEVADNRRAESVRLRAVESLGERAS